MRINYWSNSKFADKLRGFAKISCGTAEEWDEWDDTAKKLHPFRYWFVEVFLDKLQNIVYLIPDTATNIKYYLQNRFITKSNALTAHSNHVKPGNWCDLSERILYCLFDELVNFVEIEKAWKLIISDDNKIQQYNKSNKWFKKWRCSEAGLEYLDWEIGLLMDEHYGVEPSDNRYGKLTPQAETAKEIKELYIWWTQKRPHRPDPYKVSGWSNICEVDGFGNHSILNSKIPEDKDKVDDSLKLLCKLEAEDEAEDEEYLIRLIKIRRGLWT